MSDASLNPNRDLAEDILQREFDKTEPLPNEREAFLAVLAAADDAERSQVLDRACGTDAASLLDSPGNGLGATGDVPPDAAEFLGNSGPDPDSTQGQRARLEGPSTIIAGRYKLLQEIGEGGMGTVWMADQIDPIRRRVALKLIKPGMDSSQVLARFEAERQALAMMDHPHIAKVLDAGTTELGRPYFVMELVTGKPITRFCDDHQLTIPERLALFTQVCDTVQHVHQKGIIHRDLKPSNVLVESHDGKPVPKVIDFGLAKALNAGTLTERTLFTAFGAMVGTPLYMAPDQTEMSTLAADTRTDIYALGVILYELLTGTTPLEAGQLRAAAFDEVRRLIRESEPPKPSARLSSSDALPSIAALRRLEPARLAKLIRGDLDWIVMRCYPRPSAGSNRPTNFRCVS